MWTNAPALIAEALVAVREPLLTALHPGPPASPAQVAAALARSLAPFESDDEPPPWLWPEQVASFRRTLAAIRRFGGALLADPVGTGKTYVALAVASVLNRRDSTACIVPAALLSQWQDVAARTGVMVLPWSHERVSRGRLPAGCGPLAVIDESHHYRNPGTNRYSHLARWLVGRRALLVSASPLVNRVDDLSHQLALTVRDDALAGHGVPSISALLRCTPGHPELGQLIVVQSSAMARRPSARERVVALEDDALTSLAPALEIVDRLRLSADAPIAALVRGALWRAAGSSPAALLTSVDRYRRLLLHARDAAGAGQLLDRRTLRRLTGAQEDQLLFWELLGPASTGSDLAIDDLGSLDDLRQAATVAAAARDPKLDRLCTLLADARCTLVFTVARETVRYLRDRLGGPVAWCTGQRAGIGRHATSREAVLEWFRPALPPSGNGSHAALIPRVLLTTDVAAEGLDLQRAERIVHYDLPWTPARLEQREGRARRAGAISAEVEVVRFEPAPAMEARLRQLACLAAKRRLPTAAGLDEAGRGCWRWRAEVAERFGAACTLSGVAVLHAECPGLLAGFKLEARREREAGTSAPAEHDSYDPVVSSVLWWDAAHGWSDDHLLIANRLDLASRVLDVAPAPPGAVHDALARLAPLIRERMRMLRQSRWLGPAAVGLAPGVVRRLHALARAAARDRDAAQLASLHRAARFVAGGHTAGERAVIDDLARMNDAELRRTVAALPMPSPSWGSFQSTLTGLILFLP